ncbi:MAG: hypothetical protein RLZZ582_1657, partial [Verrucomicrobiota bacterium]
MTSEDTAGVWNNVYGAGPKAKTAHLALLTPEYLVTEGRWRKVIP